MFLIFFAIGVLSRVQLLETGLLDTVNCCRFGNVSEADHVSFHQYELAPFSLHLIPLSYTDLVTFYSAFCASPRISKTRSALLPRARVLRFPSSVNESLHFMGTAPGNALPLGAEDAQPLGPMDVRMLASFCSTNIILTSVLFKQESWNARNADVAVAGAVAAALLAALPTVPARRDDTQMQTCAPSSARPGVDDADTHRRSRYADNLPAGSDATQAHHLSAARAHSVATQLSGGAADGSGHGVAHHAVPPQTQLGGVDNSPKPAGFEDEAHAAALLSSMHEEPLPSNPGGVDGAAAGTKRRREPETAAPPPPPPRVDRPADASHPPTTGARDTERPPHPGIPSSFNPAVAALSDLVHAAAVLRYPPAAAEIRRRLRRVIASAERSLELGRQAAAPPAVPPKQ